MNHPRLILCILCLLLAAASLCWEPLAAAERPNVVWILSEDNSKHYLKLFDEHGAPTPNIEKLAEHGVLFRRAFSNSPVCSVARTTLMTGIYAPRIRTLHHRPMGRPNLPEGWHLFPQYLRQAGYYTTNNSKQDYNVSGTKGAWDASSRKATWRNRPRKDQPFFHMQTFTQSHESSLHFSREAMENQRTASDPAEMAVPPYFPDTETFRYTIARYHDRIQTIDRLVGELVGQLKQDGLLEDTFIFYFGDHGGVLPRSKGYLYETGLHIPLVVHIPEKWQDRAGMKRGSETDGFVSFIDFAPTVLNLAGVEVPQLLDGKAFLGQGVEASEVASRDETFGYADRFDEKYDMCRSLRKGRFKYIRNYQAFYPDALQNNYRYRMLGYQQWRKLHAEGKLNKTQAAFFQGKQPEALYDLHADPHETRNLAGDPQHAKKLGELRSRLQHWVKGLPDLGFYPESVLVEDRVMKDPTKFASSHAGEVAELVDIADLALLPFGKAQAKLKAALASENPWHRYWALIDCSVFGKEAQPLVEDARQRLEDDNLLVRMRAAEFLGIVGAADPMPALKEVLRQSDSEATSLLTLNTVVFFRDGPWDYDVDLTKQDIGKQAKGQVTRRMQYLGIGN